jgi:hypothetical protein
MKWLILNYFYSSVVRETSRKVDAKGRTSGQLIEPKAKSQEQQINSKHTHKLGINKK